MKKDTSTPVFDYSPKSRRSKNREVSSRFLSPTSSIDSGSGMSSPTQTLSPTKRKTGSTTIDTRKHKSVDEVGSIRGLWPSAHSSSKKIGTLADHLGNDRLKDLLDSDKSSSNYGPQFLGRQKSSSEFNRFEKEKESSKENHRPIFGGSMRYTGKLKLFPGKSSKSSSHSNIVPGRLSVDENNLNRRRVSDNFAENLSSESECSDYGFLSIGKSSSSTTYLASTASSRRLAGVEVSSRYMQDALTKTRRGTSDSNILTPDNSHSFNNLPPKNGMKRANSLTAYKSTISQWAMSPGRTGSPPMSVENKGKPVASFSSLRPPSSPSRSKGVSNLFNLGLDLFKSKKSSSKCSSPVGHGVGENSHQLRMLHNRLIQWRFVNSRADTVNSTKMTEAEGTMLNAGASLSNLQSSVAQKRIQFEKEKLEFNLNSVLQSQIDPLEAWGDMERHHVLALSTTKDCLHSVVCKVPLIEGAKVDPQPTSVALRHALDLTSSIKTMLTYFSPMAQKEGELLMELAEVVTVEKSLLEECFDFLGTVSALEVRI
ncbi:hypothetical protein IFM89_015379 [Coptis chinensis]|uniref:QWRF motif-containing protein 3 n=1 Tax=Coptis chinensis TaxID=261450 RepID=A0A835ICA8_9MAGN|nr:hypothetical protein IFM89_015379 [Coptis chinensis]